MKLKKRLLSTFLFLTINCLSIIIVSVGIFDILIDYEVIKYSLFYNVALILFFFELLFYSLALCFFFKKSYKFIDFYSFAVGFTLLYMIVQLWFKKNQKSGLINENIAQEIGFYTAFILIFGLFIYSIFYFKKKIIFNFVDEINEIGKD